MKHYKPPKTRIKVITIIKNGGAVESQYIPQVENDEWLLCWIFSPILIPILIMSILPPTTFISIMIIKNLKIYHTIDYNIPFTDDFKEIEKGTLLYAEKTIEKYIQDSQNKWVDEYANKIIKKQKKYINYP